MHLLALDIEMKASKQASERAEDDDDAGSGELTLDLSAD